MIHGLEVHTAKEGCPSARSRTSTSNVRLLRWREVELTVAVFVKKCTLCFVGAAPMLVTGRYANESAGADAFIAGFVAIKIGALNHQQFERVRVRVHSSVPSRLHLRELPMCSCLRIAPYRRHAHARQWTVFERHLIGRRIDQFV